MGKIAKKKREPKIRFFGFRLNDTTALLLFFIAISFTLTGIVGIIATATIILPYNKYLGWMYFFYFLTIFFGLWFLRKALMYRRQRNGKFIPF